MPALPVTVSGLKPGALGLKAFTFAPRTQKLNWRALSQVNLEKVKREVNIDTLQEYLEMVAFANAGGADVSQYADPNFIKVFQLAQLMIEYSLYSQEVIDEARLNLQKEFEAQKAKADKATKSEKELKDQVAMLKKELKLQRKTIAVYEDRLTKVMSNEAKMKQTTTQLACQICGKMFATPAYLSSHMARRHTLFPGSAPVPGAGMAPPGLNPMAGGLGAVPPGGMLNPAGGMLGGPSYGSGGSAQPLNPVYDAPATAGAPPTGATSKLASNAGELLSESDDEMAGTGDKVAQRAWKASKKEAATVAGEQTDEALSKRLRQLYQNMDDDLSIKLDRERMEFMRREDAQKHAHKLELSRLEHELRELKMGMASRSAMGGMAAGGGMGGGGGGGAMPGSQTPGTVSNAGMLEDDHIPLGQSVGGGAGGMMQPQQGVVLAPGQHAAGGSGAVLGMPGSGAGALVDDGFGVSSGFASGAAPSAQAVPLGPASQDDMAYSGAQARPRSDKEAIEMDKARARREGSQSAAAAGGGGGSGVTAGGAKKDPGTWVEAPKDPNDSRRGHQPVKEGLQGGVIRSQFEIDKKELTTGKEKVKEGLQDQLVERNLPQSGKGAERLSADDFAERERQLREERERSDSSMAKRGLSEERNRIRDRLNALERQKTFTDRGGTVPSDATRAASGSGSNANSSADYGSRDAGYGGANGSGGSRGVVSASTSAARSPSNMPPRSPSNMPPAPAPRGGGFGNSGNSAAPTRSPSAGSAAGGGSAGSGITATARTPQAAPSAISAVRTSGSARSVQSDSQGYEDDFEVEELDADKISKSIF